MGVGIGEAACLIVDYLKDADLRDAVVSQANAVINVPFIGEGTEYALLNAAYGAILAALERVAGDC